VSEQTSLLSETVFKDMHTFDIQCQLAEIFLLKKEKIEWVAHERFWAEERDTW